MLSKKCFCCWCVMCLHLQVVFEVGFNSQTGGHIALDDISFSPEFCSTDTGEQQPLHTFTSTFFSSSSCFLFPPQSRPLTPPSPTATSSQVSAATRRRRGRHGGWCRWSPTSSGMETTPREQVWVWQTEEMLTCSKRGLHPDKGCPLPPGSFLLAHSRFGPSSTYVSRVLGPALAGNMKYCLRFFFSLRGEEWGWTSIGVWICRRLIVTFVLCRLQPDGPGFSCLPAAAQRGPGTDLDSGGEVQRSLDRSRRQLPDVTGGQGVCVCVGVLMESQLRTSEQRPGFK